MNGIKMTYKQLTARDNSSVKIYKMVVIKERVSIMPKIEQIKKYLRKKLFEIWCLAFKEAREANIHKGDFENSNCSKDSESLNPHTLSN
jgi:hypothetical protein